MIRPAWETSIALHAGAVGLLFGFSWAEPPVLQPVRWEVKLAVEREQTPSPAIPPPAAAPSPQPESAPATPPAIAASPDDPAAPPAVTTPPATPPKPTKRIVARQALDPPPAQRRPKPPPVAPSAPAVLSETPRRPVKRDTEPSVTATPTKPVLRSGEEPVTAGKAEPGASLPSRAGATFGLPGEKTATPDRGRAEAKQHWYAALVVKLREMRRYPPVARRFGQEGVVILAIEIGANGELRSATVRKSSGSSLLDQAATHLIRDAVAALSGQLSPPGDSRLEIPVAYRLDN